MGVLRATFQQLVLSLVTIGLVIVFPGAAIADGSFVISGGAYLSQIDEDLGVLFNDSDSAYTGTIGWRFNEWISIDAGYWDLGEYNSDRFGDGYRIDAKVDSWSLGAIVGMPIGIVDIYLRGGMAFWEADARIMEESDQDPYYGFGLGFNLGDDLQIYSEWIRFDIAASIDTLGVGLRLSF